MYKKLKKKFFDKSINYYQIYHSKHCVFLSTTNTTPNTRNVFMLQAPVFKILLPRDFAITHC